MATRDSLISIDKLKQVVTALLAVPKREIEAAEARRLRKAPRKAKSS